MKFELNKTQLEKLEEWMERIRKRHNGRVGYLTYSFTETGIGCVVTVKSSKDKEELDLSEVENW